MDNILEAKVFIKYNLIIILYPITNVHHRGTYFMYDYIFKNTEKIIIAYRRPILQISRNKFLSQWCDVSKILLTHRNEKGSILVSN